MATIKSTDETFNNIIKDNKIVITDFWANWCSPCLTLAPILEELSDELKDKGVVIAKHNIDEEPNLPTKFSVRGIPTMTLHVNSEHKDTKVGLTTKSDLKSWIEEKRQIDLFDNGNKIRNILHGYDAVKSILLAIRSFSSLNEYEEFNIGSKDSITLAEITSSLIDLRSVETTVNLLDNSSKSEDVYIDNSEAISKIGYAPITIRDGLKKYLKEYDYEI